MKMKQLIALMIFACVMLITAHEAQAFYNPSAGRWLNRDPIGEKGGPNLYGFVRNAPVGFVDTDGRQLSPPLCNTCGQVALPGHKCVPPPPTRPPDPTGFALCKRNVQPDNIIEEIYFRWAARQLEPGDPTDHAYIHYKHCDTCPRQGWGIGGTRPGAPPIPESKFGPNSCKPCKRTASPLQYGAEQGRPGDEASDEHILDCIKQVKTSKPYVPYGKNRYQCLDWAKEAAAACGLDCN